MTAAERALEFIEDGFVVGLGTGRAATAFVHALGQRVQAGLRIRGVPTSEASATLAQRLGIPLVGLDAVTEIDIDIDGADEVDPKLNLIKGLGGALIREKIVAAASRRLVILVGPEKLVAVLGMRGTLPVEVVPFGVSVCRRRLEGMGFAPTLRQKGGRVFISDNGNNILDCKVTALPDPKQTEQQILAIPGVVGTGLFLGMADTVLVDDGGTVQIKQRGN